MTRPPSLARSKAGKLPPPSRRTIIHRSPSQAPSHWSGAWFSSPAPLTKPAAEFALRRCANVAGSPYFGGLERKRPACAFVVEAFGFRFEHVVDAGGAVLSR